MHFECVSYNSVLAGATRIILQTPVTAKKKKRRKSERVNRHEENSDLIRFGPLENNGLQFEERFVI